MPTLSWIVSTMETNSRKLQSMIGMISSFFRWRYDKIKICIEVGISKYLQSLLDEWGGSGANTSPADTDLFRTFEGAEPADDEKRKMFHVSSLCCSSAVLFKAS
jgi:hypothetical protein